MNINKVQPQFYCHFVANKVYFLASLCQGSHVNAKIIYIDVANFPFTDLSKQNSLISAVEIIDNLCERFQNEYASEQYIVDKVNVLIDAVDIKINQMQMQFATKLNALTYDDIFYEVNQKSNVYKNAYLAQVVVNNFDAVTNISFSQPISSKSRLLNLNVNGYYLPKEKLSFYYQLFSKTYVKVDHWLLLPLTIYDFISNQLTAHDIAHESFVLYFNTNETYVYKYSSVGELLVNTVIPVSLTSLLTNFQTKLSQILPQVSLDDCMKLLSKYAMGIKQKNLFNKYFTFKNVFYRSSDFFNRLSTCLQEFQQEVVSQLISLEYDKSRNKVFCFNVPSALIDMTSLLASQNFTKIKFLPIVSSYSEFDDTDNVGLFSALNYTCNVLYKQFEYQLTKNKKLKKLG